MAPPFALHKCSAFKSKLLSYKTWTGFQDSKIYWINTSKHQALSFKTWTGLQDYKI
jgi:hypothetical protein